MVKIRLSRTGRKNYATYRIVAIDHRKARDSKALDQLGHYMPHTKEIKINAEKVEEWLSKGAQPSATVHRLLVKEGIMDASTLPEKDFHKEPGEKAKERAERKAEKSKEQTNEADSSESKQDAKAEEADADEDAAEEEAEK